MEFIDILILVVAIGIVLCVIRYQVVKKRSGKSCGCGGCSHCPLDGQCGNVEKKDETAK